MKISKSIRSTVPRTYLSFHAIGLVAASALLGGCGPAEDAVSQGEPSEGVAEVQAAVVDCSTIQATSTAFDAKKVLNLLKKVASAVKDPSAGNAIEIAGAIFDFSGGPTVDQQIAALNERLFCLAQALDWKMVALDYNTNQFAPVSAAWMEARSRPFTRGSPYDTSSHNATVAAGGRIMFDRLYNPGDPTTNGPWKQDSLNGRVPLITNNQPTVTNGQVFDWRMALPGFTRLLAARIAIIAMMDPNFATNGSWNAELGDGTPSFPGYRGVLKNLQSEMIAGVRCDFKDRVPSSSNAGYSYTDLACADVNTGIYAMTTYTRQDAYQCNPPNNFSDHAGCMLRLPSQATVNSTMDSLRRNVLNQMPVFELQSMIDTLALYTRPMPDLTKLQNRIPLAANVGLCLDVPGANSASGTALQIYSCNGSAAQQFSYDRTNQTIRNPTLGKCLQVRPNRFSFFGRQILIDNPLPGAIAEISDCTNPPIARQQWTFDPLDGILRSGVGTVLDVQWGNLSAGVPVWLWDYNNGGAQRWHADRSSTDCSGACYPICQAGCAGAGPGTGQCIGSCMGPCVGSCMSSWP